jgi:hypothetical protein
MTSLPDGARSTLGVMDVLFRTGSRAHRLPEPAAVLLAENLRAVAKEGDASRSAADRIERFLVGETSEPVEFADGERVAVRDALDAQMVGDRSPALRELFDGLPLEWTGGS